MELTLVRESGDVLCRHCEIADSPLTRAKGLLGRSSLPEDQGLLLATSAIHTYFMRFPLDLVFLDKNFVVVRTVSAVKPWRVAIDRRARSVVELAAGVVETAGVQEGEQVSLVRHGERTTHAHFKTNGNGGQIRVAVASSDTRFLRVSRFLLTRHAFEVETYGDPAELLDDSQTHADVVLLDSSTSMSVAARVIRDLAVLSPTTAFVVVGEQLDQGQAMDSAQWLRVLPKWESFDRLVAEIHSASVAEGDHEFA
jgi:uncharacterized membrane protein (UPF0127 family)